MDTDSVAQACGLVRGPHGPLAPCQTRLPREPLVRACVADKGLSRGNRKVLCAFLQAYVAACQTTAGGSVRPWRAPSFCCKSLAPEASEALGGWSQRRRTQVWFSHLAGVG